MFPVLKKTMSVFLNGDNNHIEPQYLCLVCQSRRCEEELRNNFSLTWHQGQKTNSGFIDKNIITMCKCSFT